MFFWLTSAFLAYFNIKYFRKLLKFISTTKQVTGDVGAFISGGKIWLVRIAFEPKPNHSLQIKLFTNNTKLCWSKGCGELITETVWRLFATKSSTRNKI